MTTRTTTIIGCLLTLMIALPFSGCNTLQGDWQEAKQLGTVRAYERFLKKYPNAEQANDIKQLLPELRIDEDWNKTQSANDLAAYEQFLKQYPEAKQANQAKGKLEDLRFKTAEEKDSIEAYEVYLKHHPDGSTVRDAQKRLRELRYIEAKNKLSVATIESFLAHYSNGEDVDTLKEVLPQTRAFEKSRILAYLITRHFPEASASMDGLTPGKLEITPSVPTPEDLSSIKKRLIEGANPNGVRIIGYEPPGEKKQGGYVLLSPGSSGRIVRAEEGGITLLEFCRLNNLESIAELLLEHGAE